MMLRGHDYLMAGVITCVLGFFGACDKGGCDKRISEPTNALRPQLSETAGSSANVSLPSGIENPPAKKNKAYANADTTKSEYSDHEAKSHEKRPEAVTTIKENTAVIKKASSRTEKKQSSATVIPPATATPATPPPRPEPPPSVEAKAPTKVAIPQTDNVKADVPAGLQRFLDADPRMQPWVNKVMSVAEQCYAKERASNPLAKGVISVNIVMHQNERPDASLGSLPVLLAGIIPCATSKLMGSRMPLFTGDEGAKYTVRIHFTQ
jgi:hypothetical protein